MSRHLGKTDPKHLVPPFNRCDLPLNDLQTSTGNLREHLGARKELDRVLTLLEKEERETNSSYVTYDRLKRLLRDDARPKS